MGTPWQGALVHSLQACLQLESTIDVEILDGMKTILVVGVYFNFMPTPQMG